MKPGDVVGERYTIQGVLGKGGMGVVYAALDQEAPDLLVALKQMSIQADDPQEREDAIRQFIHEAQILRSLRHANIPRVHHCFEENDQYYLVMDLIEGRTMTEFVDLSGRRPPAYQPSLDQVIDWALQIARVLGYLHNQKPSPVVYKDLKPDNMMVTHDGCVMLLDFGIAKSLTSHGRFSTILKGVGSPGFAAPEQYARQQSDPRADLYALGATLYALLTAVVPIDAVDRQQALLDGQPDPLEPLTLLAPDVPKGLESIVRRLMAVRKSDRYQRSEDVLKALEGFRDGGEVRRLPGMMSKVLSNLWKPSRPSRRPAQEAPSAASTGPSEWVVGGPGFALIGDAVRKAAAGDVIRILPGHYTECVVIDRPLTLEGDGHPDDIRIEGHRGSALLVVGASVEVRTLSLSVTQTAAAPAVEVRKGALRLDGCRISSASLAGVHIRGSGTSAVLQGCEVSPAAEAGILIDDSASAVIEDCEVRDSLFAGIEVAEGAEAIVRRCVLADCASLGLYVHGDARGTFEDCDIAGSGQAGVTLSDRADPVMTRCRIRDGRGRGLVVGASSLGVFEACEIVNHPAEGVLLFDGANPELRRCRIADGGKDGVVVRGDSYGLFEDTEIFNNHDAGVAIFAGTDPILRRCRISHNFVAVKAQARAKGTVEHCDLRGNHRSVFDIDARSQVKQNDNQG